MSVILNQDNPSTAVTTVTTSGARQYAFFANNPAGNTGLAGTGNNYGVLGYGGTPGTTGSAGVYGYSVAGYGVIGTTSAFSYSGLTGTTSTANTAAIAAGSFSSAAYAAYFTGSIVVNGSFTVFDPTQKHGAIKASDGSHRFLYNMESPEAGWKISARPRSSVAGPT